MVRNIIILILLLVLGACKELNDQYPVQSWDVFFYRTNIVLPRDVSAIGYTSDHEWWLGAMGDQGIIHCDGYTITETVAGKEVPSFRQVHDILRDGYGKLWVAYNGGLAYVTSGKWSNISDFAGQDVTAIALKGIAEVWVAVKHPDSGGIACLQNNKWNWLRKNDQGLPTGLINSIRFDAGQNLWVATADKGLLLYNGVLFSSIQPPNSIIQSRNITCLSVTGSEIWAGTEDAHLLHYNGASLQELSTGINHPLKALQTDRNGKLWIASLGGGLVTYDGSQWVAFTKQDNRLPSDSLFALALTTQGKILAACAGGKIIRFNP